MNKKMSKRQRDIKSKLMAAICMLLVSSIMMVSTTYAWFTLSTAPEVTGVNTSVGANGNLEMALLPEVTGNPADVPESTASDGSFPIAQKNRTWGNLVDVSDNAIYGTDQFKLYPSQLNLTGNSIGVSILSTPKYGADGRVAQLETETVTSHYDAEGKKFVENSNFGVRGIGNADGKTPRQAALTNALSNAAIYRNSAKDLASASLSDNGAVLGEIAIAAAMGGDVNETHKTGLGKMITGLNASLDAIEMAYKQYILAFAASDNVSNEAAWTAVSAVINNSLTEILDLTELAGHTLPAELTDLFDDLAATRSDVTDAENLLETADASSVDDLKAVMAKLADPDKMELFGKTIREAMDDKAYIISQFNGTLDLTILPGGGVYADIAEHCGDYSAGLVLKNVDVPGVGELSSVNANMSTVTAGEGKPYLTAIGTLMAGYSAPAGSSDELVISDFYGYIIDLAFRTNASNSKLQLQPDGIDRIYNQTPGVEDDNHINTMGNGASMTFTKGSDGFSDDQMKNLMKSIKIVFFTPDATKATTGTVVGYAALDADNATNTAEGMKAKLKMVTAAGADTGSNEIMDLVQNTPTALSVLVYLDGNSVRNADVAIGAASMVGKLNLQFSSSAALVPMDYTPLKNGNTMETTPEEGGEGGSATTNFTNVTSNSGTAGVVASGSFDAEGKATITVNGLAEGETISGVSVNGTDVTSPEISGNTVTFTQTGLNAGDAIIVKTSIGA